MFHRGINKEHFKRRDLPHWDDPGRRMTLIYRLWDSIPQSKIQEIVRLAAQNKWDIGDYTLRRLMEESLHHGYGCGLLKYPEIAKKRNMSGSVTLHLTTDNHLNLTECFLVKSSGYKILDNDAMELVRNIFPLEGVDDTEHPEINEEITIDYRLNIN